MPQPRLSPALIADVLLGAAIVLSVVVGGSTSLAGLPFLALILAGALGASVFEARRRRGYFRAPLPAMVLLGLAGFTLLQSIPLPGGLLGLLSPAAVELRSFVIDSKTGSIAYESNAALIEASKLFLYALVAAVAFERARARKSFGTIGLALVVSGVAAGAIGVVDRALGLRGVLGVIETMKPRVPMLTTFVNPNHAAGFMALAALASAGLALSDSLRHRRAAYLLASAFAGTISVLCLSNGGLLALGLGVCLWAAVLLRLRSRRKTAFSRLSPAIIILALILPAVGGLYAMDEVVGELTNMSQGIEVAEKLDAARDAVPMVKEHAAFGIGRGSYASLYAKYKKSPWQVTFTHPENIVVQLIAEWGLFIGGAALLLLLFALGARLIRSQSLGATAALAGATALLVQNLVDFSLELPGAAIPFAAVLGAGGFEFSKSVRVSVKNPFGLGGISAVACAAILLAFVSTFSGKSLKDDLDDIVATSQGVERSGKGLRTAEIEAIAKTFERHPANGVIATNIAFLWETAAEPNLKRAFVWANRALFLAPTYAEAHLLTARLLFRAGKRAQALMEMRIVFGLSTPPMEPRLFPMIARAARDGREALATVPFLDAEHTRIDDARLTRLLAHLVSTGKKTFAAQALRSIDFETVDAPAFSRLASLAMRADDVPLARQIAHRMQALHPDDPEAALLAASLAMKAKDLDQAKQILDGLIKSDTEVETALHMRMQIAMKEKDETMARAILLKLKQGISPDIGSLAWISEQEASLETRFGRPDRALNAVEEAIRHAPGDLRLRLQRARILIALERPKEARKDLDFVLSKKASHSGALRLLQRIEKMKDTP